MSEEPTTTRRDSLPVLAAFQSMSVGERRGSSTPHHVLVGFMFRK